MRRALRMVVLCVLASVAPACGGGDDADCDVMYETERESLEALGTAFCEWEVRCGQIVADVVDECVEAYVMNNCDADCDTGEPELPCDAVHECVAKVEDLSCAEGPVNNACN